MPWLRQILELAAELFALALFSTALGVLAVLFIGYNNGILQ